MVNNAGINGTNILCIVIQLCSAILLINPNISYCQPPSTDYKLVFSDYFGSNTIDENSWWIGGDNFCETQCGDGCDCFFWYRHENAIQSNSRLTLIGKLEENYCNDVKRNHTSGKVLSAGEFKYGYFEIRAKVPSGIGYWPAFWFWSGNYEENYQEIDMFEFCGCDCYKFQAGYFYENDSNGILGDNVLHVADKVQVGNNACEHFNIYGLEWREDSILYYVNSVLKFSTNNISVSQRMALILNLAIGGCWNCGSVTCNPDHSTIFPGSYEIDWVKIWGKEEKAIEIIGAEEMCIGDAYDFKANNYPNATYTWSSSSGLSVYPSPWFNFDGGTWKSANVTALSSGNQKVILTVSFPSGYTETKIFEVKVQNGTPEAPNDVNAVLEGNSCCYTLSLPVVIPDATIYLWEINDLNGDQSQNEFSTNEPKSGICFTDKDILVKVAASNSCGTSDYYVEHIERPLINGCPDHLQVFPNPAEGHISIYLKQFLPGNNSDTTNVLIISDILGRIIYTADFNDYFKTIDIQNFRNGIYFIYVKYKSTELNSKFLKLNAN